MLPHLYVYSQVFEGIAKYEEYIQLSKHKVLIF